MITDAYIPVEELFDIKAALITNESRLEDFISQGIHLSPQGMYEMFFDRIKETDGVMIPPVFDGETRVWKVTRLVKEKLLMRNSTQSTFQKFPN